MIRGAGIALAVLLFAVAPAAAFSITPADGWLWNLDVALDDLRVRINPAIAPHIEAERVAEAQQMVASGDIAAAQQAMNHVQREVQNRTAISPFLADFEESETADWNALVTQYGISDVNAAFTIPPHLKSVPDGEYVISVTTTSGTPLGTYTAMKAGNMTYARSGEASGELGEPRLHWTYTASEMQGFVEQYEGITGTGGE